MALVFPEAEITGHISGGGLSSRKPVRVATTIPGTLATSFADGQTIDGVIVNTGDRLLIKNQTDNTQNGVYTVQASGAPARATDYDDGDAVGGSFVYVQEGVLNGSTGWLCTSPSGADIISTNNITFKLISGDASGGGVSTDNAIVRWDGTTGTKIQNSGVIVDDSNNMSGLGYVQFSDIAAPSNPLAGQGRLYKKTGDDGIWWRPDAAGPEVDLTVGGVTSFQTSLSGLSPSILTTGPVTLSGTLGATSGGTGTSTAPTAGQLPVGTSGGAYVPYTVTTGTGISTTTGSGTFQINNTGVTSVAGTANQVAVSGATGAVTLSTPNVFIAPGTIQDTTGMRYSTSSTVTALGATQGTATILTTSHNVVTSSAAGTGVRLPTPPVGMRVVIANKSANTINVYPDVGGAIDSAGTNIAVTLFADAAITLQAATTTQWYTVGAPIVPGAGMTVVYGDGKTTVTAIGGGVSPLTTKGDIWAYSAFDARLPVGASGSLLTADPTQAIGLKWTPFTPGLLPFAVVTDTLVADQNDYNPVGLSTAVQLRLTPSGATRTITGLTISGSSSAPNIGELKITNVGTQYNIVLQSESASSTAANRFTFDGQNVVLLPGQNCTVWYDWTTSRWRGVAASESGRMGGQYVTAGVITPPALVTSQNDYNPTGLENAAVVRIASTGIVSITGIAGGYDGRRLSLVNIGSIPIVLVNQSSSSLAANRFFTGSSNVTLVGNNTATIMYDGVAGYWRITGGTGGATAGIGGLIQTIWTEVTTDLTTIATDWPGYYSKINAAVTLPTGTITVVTTAAALATPTLPGSPAATAASVANPQTLIIQSTTNNAQIVTYTGSTGTTFTGCTGGSGALAIGNFVFNGPVQTSTSAGGTLPTGTINVVSTTGFPSTGTLLVVTSANGTQRVNYTGITGTSFTGCTGGTGAFASSAMVYNVSATAQDFLSTNITTSGGALIIIMTANASTASNRTGYFRVLVDGFVRRGGSTQGNGGAPSGSAVVSLKLSNVLAGDHVVSCQWVVEGGNFDIKPVTSANDNNASLLVQEISS